MHVMKSESKFLPDSVSGALRSIFSRTAGAVIFCVGVWLLLALFFHNSYLDGFACASTFGSQSFIGNVISFMRYMIGFIP